MADEPDNLVLVQLREMRAEMGGMRAKLEKLDEHDKRFEEMRVYVNHALGLGTMSNLKSRELDARMEAEEEVASGTRCGSRTSSSRRRLGQA